MSALRQGAAMPFAVLAEYERRSLQHSAGTPEQVDAPGLWRGIGFRVGARYLVSHIGDVNEILSVPPMAQVPGTRRWLLGIANVRGNLVPIVDLRDFITDTRNGGAESARVLLVRQAAGGVGLLVDEVLGQRSFSPEQRAQAVGETDANFARFVGENLRLGDQDWGIFSVAMLVRSIEFQQAAA